MHYLKTHEIRHIILAAFVLLIVLISSHMVVADMCCYVVPVDIVMNNDTKQKGFLILYGNEIRGYDNENSNIMKTISFGMNSPSTPERIWTSIDYEFDTIEVSNTTVSIKIGNEVHSVYKVNYFFSPKGLPFASKYWTTKEGYLRHDSINIPITNIKSIKRIGRIRSIEPYND